MHSKTQLRGLFSFKTLNFSPVQPRSSPARSPQAGPVTAAKSRISTRQEPAPDREAVRLGAHASSRDDQNHLKRAKFKLWRGFRANIPRRCAGKSPRPMHAAAPRAVPAPARPEAIPHQQHPTACQRSRLTQEAPAFPPPAFYTRGPSHWGDLTNRVAEREKRCPMAAGLRSRARPPWSCPSMVVGRGGKVLHSPCGTAGGCSQPGDPPENI